MARSPTWQRVVESHVTIVPAPGRGQELAPGVVNSSVAHIVQAKMSSPAPS
jgi:hypothetical protein